MARNKSYSSPIEQTGVTFSAKNAFSVYAHPVWAEQSSYEILKQDSFVRFHINEYGKKESVYHNLSLWGAKDLLEVVKSRYIKDTEAVSWPNAHESAVPDVKIYGNWPKNEAQYVALCNKMGVKVPSAGKASGVADAKHCWVRYEPMRRGEVSSNPWTITIQNGMARYNNGAKGSVSEVAGSFVCELNKTMYLTQSLMYNMLSDAIRILDNFESMAMNGHIPEVKSLSARYQAVNDSRLGGHSDESYDTGCNYSYCYEEPAGQELAAASQTTVQADTASKEFPFRGTVTSDVITNGAGGYKAVISCGRDAKEMHFSREMYQKLMESFKKKLELSFMGYQDSNKTIHARIV